MFRTLKNLIIFSVILIFIPQAYLYPLQFELTGKIETIRKNKIITLLFDEKPSATSYIVIEDDLAVGKIEIINISSFLKNNRIIFRALANYSIEGSNDLIKAGSTIGLVRAEEGKGEVQTETPRKEVKNYKKTIITETDYREMILIPGGKFIFGSDNGDTDEKPKRIITLDDFYIDKYEVSNSDYAIYIKKTNSKPPVSWTSGSYSEGENDFPVIVSYYEAVKYAEWAGKRLPAEEEWEKSARGSGISYEKDQEGSYLLIEKPAVYPWGEKFDASKANSSEFWNDANTGKEIKKKFQKGLLPVYIFAEAGNSIYGIANLSGNAAEWTSSWYDSYGGSKNSNKMYGRQVKVIRGGCWFNNRDKLRITNREIGGLPNLYDDNIAGFRCVKEPTIADLSKAN